MAGSSWHLMPLAPPSVLLGLASVAIIVIHVKFKYYDLEPQGAQHASTKVGRPRVPLTGTRYRALPG